VEAGRGSGRQQVQTMAVWQCSSGVVVVAAKAGSRRRKR